MDLARSQGDAHREIIHSCELDTLRARLRKMEIQDHGPTSLVPSAPPEGAVCTVIRPEVANEQRCEVPEKTRISPDVERKDPRRLAAKARRHRGLKGRREGKYVPGGGAE